MSRRSRRDLMIAVGGGAATLALWRWAVPERAPPPDFVPMARPEGFRRLRAAGGATGGGGAGGALLAGIDAAPPLPEMSAEALCAALFPAGTPAGAAPVAALTDHRCPYCRILHQRLTALQAAANPPLALSIHPWAALGPVSERMAKARLAAARQGAGAAMDALLWETRFAPGRAWLTEAAGEIGIDAGRLLRDIEDPALSAPLAEAAALARRFGFVGTPGLVIGRTVIDGAVSEPLLRQVLALEAAAGPPPGCAAQAERSAR